MLCNFCSLRCDSKTGMNFFFLLHNFRKGRFVLRMVDLSNLSKWFVFFSLLSWKLSPHLKEALYSFLGFPSGSDDKESACSAGDLSSIPGSGRSPGEENAYPFSILAWKIPWTEEPGGLQSMGSLGVRHDWATSLWLFTFMHWSRKWQPTPVLVPGESYGQRRLYSS